MNLNTIAMDIISYYYLWRKSASLKVNILSCQTYLRNCSFEINIIFDCFQQSLPKWPQYSYINKNHNFLVPDRTHSSIFHLSVLSIFHKCSVLFTYVDMWSQSDIFFCWFSGSIYLFSSGVFTINCIQTPISDEDFALRKIISFYIF